MTPAPTRQLLASTPDVKVVVLTTFEDDEYVFGALAAGASGFVVEESTVKTHVKRILMKLHARDRVQAVIYAYESGLARPGAISG